MNGIRSKLLQAATILLVIATSPMAAFAQDASAQGSSSSCFDNYRFGSVQVDVAPSIAKTIAGVPITFTGKIVNANLYPIVGGEVYVKIVKKTGSAETIQGNAYPIVDMFVVKDDIAVPANGQIPVTFDWKAPSDLATGDYEADMYFVVAHRFNLLGLTFTDDVTGNKAAFSITGSKDAQNMTFDRTSVTANSKPFHFVGAMPHFNQSEPVVLSASLVNPSEETRTVSVTWTQYNWDGQRPENKISEKTEQVLIKGKGSATTTYTATESKGTVTYLVATAKYGGVSTIIDPRFARDGYPETRINFPSITGYPLQKGVPNAVFSCLHSTNLPKVDGNTLTLTVKDADGSVIHAYKYTGAVTGDMMGVKDDFTPTADASTFSLTARLEAGGRVLDEVTQIYDCRQIDPTKCANAANGAMNPEGSSSPLNSAPKLALLVLFIAIVLVAVFKKKKNAVPPGMAIVLLALLVLPLPHHAHAASVTWTNTFVGTFGISDANLGSRPTGIANPTVNVTYNANAKNVTSGTSLVGGELLPVGTQINFASVAPVNTDITWSGTGYGVDTPYGYWTAAAADPGSTASTCFTANDYVGVDYNAVAQTDIYTPYAVAPPTIAYSHSGTAPLTCDVSGQNCTINGAGTITGTITYAATPAKFYVYNYIHTFGSPFCSKPAMFGNMILSMTVPAQTINFSFTAVAPNAPPTAPTIAGSAAGTAGTSLSYTFTSTDPDGDTLRYGIDWNNDGVVDQWAPGAGYTNSGTAQSGAFTWGAAGTYTFQALAQDVNGSNSGWTSKTITISAAPVNGVCGSANGTSVSVAPSGAALCFAGTATAVAGAGPWTWSCTGSNGGTTAACSANKGGSMPPGNWNRYQGSACSSQVPVQPGWIGACPFTFFAEPVGVWGVACDNQSYDISQGYWGGTWNCQVQDPGLGACPGMYHNYTCIPQLAQCSDGIDNDSPLNAAADYYGNTPAPAAPDHGCTSATDDDESAAPMAPLTCAGGMLPNWNFEASGVTLTNWSTVGPGTTLVTKRWVGDGNYGSQENASSQLVSTAVAVTAGTTYQLDFWAGTHDATQDQYAVIEFLNAANAIVGTSPAVQIDHNVDIDWTLSYLSEYTITGTAPAGAVKAQVHVFNNSLTGAIKFDAACLTPMAASQCNDTADNDGVDGADFGVDHGCTSAADTDENAISLPLDNCTGGLLPANWNFEMYNLTNWTAVNTVNMTKKWQGEGDYGAIVGWGMSQLLSTPVPAVPGKTYNLTFWGGTHDPTQDAYAVIDFLNGAGTIISTSPQQQLDHDVGIDWIPPYTAQYSITGVAPAGTVSARVHVYNNTPINQSVKFDGACLTQEDRAVLSVVPTTLNYGTVPIGSAPTQSFVVTNTGTAPTTITFSPPPPINGSVYSCIGANCGATLNPGQTVTVTIQLDTTAGANGPINGIGTLSGSVMAPAVNPPTAVDINLVATGNANTQLQVIDVRGGNVDVGAGPYPIAMGLMAASNPASNYDFIIRNIGSAGMSYTVTLVGATPNYSLVSVTPGGCSGAGVAFGDPDRVCRVVFTPGASVGVNRNATVRFDNTSASVIPPDPIDVNFTAGVTSGPIVQVFPGTNPVPNVIVTPTALGYDVDFGTVAVNNSVVRTITVLSAGDQPMNAANPGIATADFQAPASTQNGLPKNTSFDIPITFVPQAAGVRSGTFTITTNDAAYAGGKVVVTVHGTGLVAPILTISTQPGGVFNYTSGSGNLPFGQQDVNAGPKSLTVTIANTGTQAASITWSDPLAPFFVPAGATAIPPGGSHVFTLSFDPSVIAPGQSSATIINDPTLGNFTLNVNGDGVDSPPGLTPGSIDFGAVVVDRQKDLSVTIANVDALGRDFGTVDLSLPDPQFTCVSPVPCQIALPPGATPTIVLRFSPSSVGSKSTTLNFSGIGVINGYTIPVTGKGVRPTIQYKEK